MTNPSSEEEFEGALYSSYESATEATDTILQAHKDAVMAAELALVEKVRAKSLYMHGRQFVYTTHIDDEINQRKSLSPQTAKE